MNLKKYFLIFIFLILINGCKLTTEKIIKNPGLVAKECSKYKVEDERNDCFINYAMLIATMNSDISVGICKDNLNGATRNKCIFNIFSKLEGKDIEEAIKVCRNIEKEGFFEWCESRRSRESIAVAPPLE